MEVDCRSLIHEKEGSQLRGKTLQVEHGPSTSLEWFSKPNALTTTNIRDKNASTMGNTPLQSRWNSVTSRPRRDIQHTHSSGGDDRHGVADRR